jgi:glycine C-acetyltransferase
MMDEGSIWLSLGIHVNGIEFPVVSIGQARLRVNLMPQHTKAQLDLFVTKFESCLDQSKKMFDKMLERLEQQQKELQPKL